MVQTLAIIQARMTSERLPGKVLADLGGSPVLAHVVSRVRSARLVSETMVATSTNVEDDPVAVLAQDLGISCHRGSEQDVLGRFVDAVASRPDPPDVIVRVTGDCPLLDPGATDAVIELLVGDPTLDYTSNVAPRTYPRGLDVEAFRSSALELAAELAATADEREHVTLGMHTLHSDRFERGSVCSGVDDSDLRWTIDYPEDLEVLGMVVTALDLAPAIELRAHLPYREVVEWFRAHPEVIAGNRHRATWTPG